MQIENKFGLNLTRHGGDFFCPVVDGLKQLDVGTCVLHESKGVGFVRAVSFSNPFAKFYQIAMISGLAKISS